MSRIFLAGAAGVIGRRLTPLLLARGDTVWGATRSPDNGEFLRKLGALPVAVDVFDEEALATAVLEVNREISIRAAATRLRVLARDACVAGRARWLATRRIVNGGPASVS